MKLYDVIRKEHKDKGLSDLDPAPVYNPPPVKKNTNNKKPQPAWKKILVLGGALFFVALLYWIGIIFVHAKVVISEREIPFSLQDSQVDLVNEKTADPGRLSFQTMVVTDSVSRQVFASAMTTSTTKATGKAVIVNQYSKTSKTVKSGTVLTGANGQKYVTQSTVIVPGFVTNSKSPGSISVNIAAANVGPVYNTPGTTFTIAGWSGANSKLFFATSAGAITGGQNGAVHTLSEQDKQRVMTTLQTALAEKLNRETHSQIPSDLITFPDLQSFSIDQNSLVLQGDNIQFPASIKGTMVSYLLPRNALERTIAAKAINDQIYPTVDIPELGSIHVEPVTALPADPTKVPNDITVSISGQGTIITKVPVDAVTQAVVGISKGSFNTALSGIREIDTASYSLYPFWAPYFPYKPARITVQVR